MRILPACFVLGLLGVLAPARADPPSLTDGAACVAALKARAEPLAQRLRNGDTSAEAPLRPIVTASFAFIGSAYKQGLRKKQADEMLGQAEQRQAELPPEQLAQLQDSCQAQGQRLYAEANYFERIFVSQAANARIAKLRKRA